ncbi:MAG: cohesin domain-containing protein, partial [Clostridiales bacterium]
MKRFLLLLIVLLINTVLKAQSPSVSTSNLDALPGDTVLVPVNVTGFLNVGSILIKLQYDPVILQWINQVELNSDLAGATVTDSTGKVIIQWIGKSALNIVSGNLLNMKFIYKGGTSQLSFLGPESVMTDPLGNPFTTTYTNGSISEQKNYTLSINKTGNGSGNIKVNGQTKTLPYSGVFRGNSSVSIEAVADPGNSFTGWSGDLNSANNPDSIVIDANKTITAGFAPEVKFTLSLDKSGSGQIKVNDTIRTLPFTSVYK